MFGCASTAFGFGQITFYREPFVFPLATKVGFVNLDAAEGELRAEALDEKGEVVGLF